MKRLRGQSTIEFTFAMVMVALLIYGLIKTFRWVGMDYAQSAYTQEQSNVFFHPKGCEATASCYSLNTEHDQRRQRLDAFTRKY